jgi:hypothetical protein
MFDGQTQQQVAVQLHVCSPLGPLCSLACISSAALYTPHQAGKLSFADAYFPLDDTRQSTAA